MNTALLLLALVAANPFEDVQQRFHLDLPTGWEFAPVPGNLSGATFRRQNDGLLALAAVQVVKLQPGTSLLQFATAVASASNEEPGYELLQQANATLGGIPAIRRRFVLRVTGSAKQLVRMVEESIAVMGETGYVLHTETLADVFGSFERDFATMQATFAPGSLAPAPNTAAWSADAAGLIGRWEGSGHVLQLSPGGSVVLDKDSGRYKFETGLLIMTLEKRRAVVAFERHDNVLRLSGDLFGTGVDLRRVPAATPAPSTIPLK